MAIDSLFIAAGYHNLGAVYTRYGKYKEGFEMQNKALEISKAINDDRMLGYLHNMYWRLLRSHEGRFFEYRTLQKCGEIP